MSKDYFECSLVELQAELPAIRRDAEAEFGRLSATQLNWKPSADSWSVAQCLDHIMITNRAMLPPLQEIAEGRKRATLWERVPFLPGLVGRQFAKFFAPSSTQKFKAPPKVQPAASALDQQIVKRYVAHQGEMESCFKALAQGAKGHIVMVSPLMRVMTYSALDACRIIVAHERRHMAQAQRVKALPEFPKA